MRRPYTKPRMEILRLRTPDGLLDVEFDVSGGLTEMSGDDVAAKRRGTLFDDDDCEEATDTLSLAGYRPWRDVTP